MKGKKTFRYFLLPILTILFVPIISSYFQKTTPIRFVTQFPIAIICGLVYGGIRILWDNFTNTTTK